MSKNIIEIALKAGFINTSNGLESPFIEGEDLTDNLKLFASLLLAQPELKERELLRTALIALEDAHLHIDKFQDEDTRLSVMEQIKELLAQPEHKEEPVAWMYDWEYTLENESMQNRMTKIKAVSERPEAFNVRPLYTAPPKREPLSYEHLEALVDTHHGYPMTLGRAIEEAHGIGG
jgi:hypothetical protein